MLKEFVDSILYLAQTQWKKKAGFMSIECKKPLQSSCCICLSLVILTLNSSCEKGANPPPKPLNVPLSAQWAGGVDGGVWITCQVSEENKMNLCSIYDHPAGHLLKKGGSLGIAGEGPRYSGLTSRLKLWQAKVI
jgi:hypothetical protein